MLNLGYVAQRLRRPLPTKDGGTLHTVADAANYIVLLPPLARFNETIKPMIEGNWV